MEAFLKENAPLCLVFSNSYQISSFFSFKAKFKVKVGGERKHLANSIFGKYRNSHFCNCGLLKIVTHCELGEQVHCHGKSIVTRFTHL
jgi:hypothetical protein